MELTHGGDIAGYARRYGRRPLDFSASLNPLGMPPVVRDAARAAVDESFAYPDPLCRDLVAALAARLSLPESHLLCGNGAADVIFRLALGLRPRRALLTAPTFSEYGQALATVGCHVEYHALRPDNDFVPEDDILDRIVPGLDILFLCQPNNPTGQLIEADLMHRILDRCAATKSLLFVDECFCHFVDEPEKRTLIGRVAAFPNLFILDSFTKLYGMAGIRLGYGVSSDAGLMERLRAAGQPWPVSTVAQAAGLAALGETAYVDRSLGLIAEAKPKLVDGLRARGNEVIGFAANYVFFRSPVPDLDARLMRQGVLIRNCGNFRGLGPGYFRVAVRLEKENETLLRAMDAVENGEPWQRQS